jgi:hypothetical protein
VFKHIQFFFFELSKVDRGNTNEVDKDGEVKLLRPEREFGWTDPSGNSAGHQVMVWQSSEGLSHGCGEVSGLVCLRKHFLSILKDNFTRYRIVHWCFFVQHFQRFTLLS